jgi:hypothetical protein
MRLIVRDRAKLAACVRDRTPQDNALVPADKNGQSGTVVLATPRRRKSIAAAENLRSDDGREE